MIELIGTIGTDPVGPGLGKHHAINFLQMMPIRTGIMLIGINLFSMSRLDYTLNTFSLDSSTILETIYYYRNPLASSNVHIFILTTIIVVMTLLALTPTSRQIVQIIRLFVN